MTEYHGILLDLEFKDKNFIKNFKILGSRKSTSNPWTLYKIKIPEKDLENTIKSIQENLIIGSYYAHLYRDEEVRVIFKHKIFRVTPDKSTWQPVIDYGLSIGIPLEQLDMKPCRFEDETY